MPELTSEQPSLPNLPNCDFRLTEAETSELRDLMSESSQYTAKEQEFMLAGWSASLLLKKICSNLGIEPLNSPNCSFAWLTPDTLRQLGTTTIESSSDIPSYVPEPLRLEI